MVFCVMILCTFTGVLCGTRGDGVRRWWSTTQGMALRCVLSDVQKEHEETLGQKETLRNEIRLWW